MKPHTRLLLALILGIFFGLVAHAYSTVEALSWVGWVDTHVLTVIGQIFLRIIFMVVVPMVFCALVLGVYELGQGKGFGRVAGKTLFYTLLASGASVAIGIGLVTLLRPGAGLNLSATATEKSAAVSALESKVANTKSFSQIIVELIPKNPIDSAVRAFDGEIIALMVFALFFGFALSQVDRDKKFHVLHGILEEVLAVSMHIIGYAMHLAPYAIFGMIFHTTFTQGGAVLLSLGLYVGTVVLAILVQQFGVYSLLLKVFTQWSPLDFFWKCKDVYLYAFSTASSNATLPKSLHAAEHDLKLSPKISRFVLTVGASANQNGTALFEGITVLFLAQAYNIELGVMQQFQVVLMSILAGIGTAGVPGGSLPLIMILLQSVGIPAEAIGIILGVDRFLDMCRTTLNVSGDLVIAALVDGNKK